MTGGMRLLLDRIQFWQEGTDWALYWQYQAPVVRNIQRFVSAEEELLFNILKSIDIRSLARNKVLLNQILKSLHEIHLNKRNIS